MSSKLRFEGQAELGNETSRHEVVFLLTFSLSLRPVRLGLEVES